MKFAFITGLLFLEWARLGAAAQGFIAEETPIYKLDGGWDQVWQLYLQQGVRALSARGPVRIVFLGDSTLRFQQRALCRYFRRLERAEEAASAKAADPSPLGGIEAGRRLRRSLAAVPGDPESDAAAQPPPPKIGALKTCDARPPEPTLCGWGNISALYTCNYACDYVAPQAVERLGPYNGSTVLYHNCGLHMLHLGQWKPFETHEAFGAAAGVEEHLHRVWASAFKDLHADVLVYMTTHSICEQNYNRGFAEAVRALARHDEAVTERDIFRWCAANHTGWAEPAAVEEVCRWALFTDSGVRQLNARALTALDRFRLVQPGRVGLVDAYGLTHRQCWASKPGDGRHYGPLLPLQLQNLLSQVRHLLPLRSTRHKRWLRSGGEDSLPTY